VSRGRIGVVPPGVSVAVAPAMRSLRTATPLRLLVVASVTPRKGYAVLVEALARLRDRTEMVPAFQVDCYGSLDRDPACVGALRRSLAQCGLADIVCLHGEVDEATLTRAYGAADLFVHAALYEGYGMAVADALAAGLPVVAAAGGAVADLVPRSAGLLVPPDDPAALAAALARAAGDTVLRVALAEGARLAGARLPDWRTAADLFAGHCARMAP
jgi:glycosyltransferase involved in cell wall biosynthesis